MATSLDRAASSLQVGQMQSFFETVARILNDYSVHFDKSRYSLEFVAEDNVDDVLRLLESVIERPGSS